MNVKLVYCTRTNHSKKIADSIAAAVQIPAENVADKPALENVDLLFLVGGIYSGDSLPGMIAFVESLDQNKVRRVALVTSCVSYKMPQKAVRNLLLNKGIVVVDEFMCKGSFLIFGLRHPNQTDFDNAAQYAKGIMENMSGMK